MMASPAITTPRPSRWSMVSRRESSSSFSGIRGFSLFHSSPFTLCEAIRRPRARNDHRHPFPTIARFQLCPQVLQTRFLVTLDQNVDLREGPGALRSRLRDGVTSKSLDQDAPDLTHHLLLGLPRGALPLIVQFLAQEECAAGGGDFDLSGQVAQRVHARHEGLAPALGLELHTHRPLLFPPDAPHPPA